MNYYLHKHNKEKITTTKDNIIFDLDKVINNYEFVYNTLKKYPTTLEIIGKNSVTFNRMTFCYDFPVEKIIINTSNIITFSSKFYNFYNAKTLELTDIAKSIQIYDNLGLKNLENIIIPFTIDKFISENIYENSILKTLTIYNNDDKLILDLDECLINKKSDINIKNNDNKLNIKLTCKNVDIEYNVYLKDNKLTYDKKYNKYEINGENYHDDILNIIELKKKYNEIVLTGDFIHTHKIILKSSDIEIFTQNQFFSLNELEIKDDNNMSLLPRDINIKLDDKRCEYFNLIEKLGNNLLLRTNKYKHIIINEDLSLIEINKRIFLDVILDYNANKFKYENDYILTIPFNIETNQKKSCMLNSFIKEADNILVRKNDKTYNINLKHLSIINYKNEDSFDVEYLHEILSQCGEVYRKVIGEYKFNTKPEFYTKGSVLKKELNIRELPRRY